MVRKNKDKNKGEKMRKCCFIVPYFGKMPEHFNVFLKTCEYNKDYNWIIFTDDQKTYHLPTNVKIIQMTFKGIQELVQSKFDFNISLNRPYKLCDYKPAYGYVFEEYIQNYRFWGHCDLDTIMGNLNEFITDEMLEKYDKLFCLGHFILYKNNFENNRLFMSKYNGIELYKKVFTTSKIMIFDETVGGSNNINSIFLDNNKKIFMGDFSLNFKILPTKFIRTKYNYLTNSFDTETYKKALYVWNNGNLERYYMNKDKIVKEKFMYAHFQGRIMRVKGNILDENMFKILPNVFTKLEIHNITRKTFKKIKKERICFHYFERKLRNMIKRIKNRRNKEK